MENVNETPAAPIWQPSAPDRIEADLVERWRVLARGGRISRARMSNLVVVTECSQSVTDVAPSLGETLVAAVAKKHPARIILLGYTPGIRTAASPKSARVAVLTHGDAQSKCGVELIAVHAPSADRHLVDQ